MLRLRVIGRPAATRTLVLGFSLVGVALMLLPSGGGMAPASHPASVPLQVAAVTLPSVSDGATIQTPVGSVNATLSDNISFGPPLLDQRSYRITIKASVAAPLVGVQVVTNPLLLCSNPLQMPWGPDALPPASDWRWTVFDGKGLNDTANWTTPRWTHNLARSTTWVDQTYFVTGYTSPVVPLLVNLPFANTSSSPGVGLVFNPGTASQGPLYPANDTDYAKIVQGLRPSLLRFGVVDAGTGAYWNSSGAPTFNFSALDRTFNLSAAIHARVLYSISAGTWGDGNLMPGGTPLNTTILITKGATSGYMPTPAAYRTYVGALVNHTAAMNQSVAYWTIGNELPMTNYTVVNAFIQLFNVAQQVIHARYPNALVGSDVMMDRTYLPDFAQNATNVGFLSFHFYPSIGLCDHNGTYCPPAGPGQGTLTARLWQPVADMAHVGFYAPHLAQQIWYNYTHRWVPVFDAESNLNGIGGGAASGANGTDPRQQTLLGAAWNIATIIRGAQENITDYTYYTMTGPATTPTTVTGSYGGWGFGLSSEGLNDTDVKYAPYWALHLWAQNVPAGAPGISLPSPDPTSVRAYAVRTATGVNVIVANLVGVRVSIPVTLNSSAYMPRLVATLDQRSYVEQFNASNNTVTLYQSGIARHLLNTTNTTVTVVLDGYGVGVIRFVHRIAGHGPIQMGGSYGGNSEVVSSGAGVGDLRDPVPVAVRTGVRWQIGASHSSLGFHTSPLRVRGAPGSHLAPNRTVPLEGPAAARRAG